MSGGEGEGELNAETQRRGEREGRGQKRDFGISIIKFVFGSRSRKADISLSEIIPL
jgi:hypothetical protein